MKKTILTMLSVFCVSGACSAQAERVLPSPHICYGRKKRIQE